MYPDGSGGDNDNGAFRSAQRRGSAPPTAVVVFAKPPRAGRAKTRLARTLGPERAAELAAALLADTWRSVCALPWAVPVLSTPDSEADHGIDAPLTWPQGAGDLGARVERALRRGVEGWGSALALGADAPGLPEGHLHAARQALLRGRAALGPSEDGGFWGLALPRCPDGLLAGLPWSTSATGAATRARLVARGLPPVDLPPWLDLDEEDDLRRWRARVPRDRAPSTHAALDALWPDQSSTG